MIKCVLNSIVYEIVKVTMTTNPPVTQRTMSSLEDISDEIRRDGIAFDSEMNTPKRTRSRSLARESDVPTFLRQGVKPLLEKPNTMLRINQAPDTVRVTRESIVLLRDNLQRKFDVENSELFTVVGALEASMSVACASLQDQVAESSKAIFSVSDMAENAIERIHKLTELSDSLCTRSEQVQETMAGMMSEITEMKKTPKSLAVRIMLLVLWIYTFFETIWNGFTKQK